MNENENAKAKVMAAAVTLIVFSIFLIPFLYKRSANQTSSNDSLISLDNYSPVIDLKSSEDEVINQILANNSNATKTDLSKENLTDVVARDLFTASQYSRYDGVVAPDTVGATLAQSVTNVTTAKETLSFNLIANPTSADYKTYANNLAALHIVMTYSNSKELEYVTNYGKTEDKKYLKPVEEINEKVNRGCYLYRQIQVPKDFYELHKNLVFLCDQYDIILQSFVKADEDPVRVLAGLKIYQELRENIIQNMTSYAKEFKNKNLIFKPSDNGYIYNNLNI